MDKKNILIGIVFLSSTAMADGLHLPADAPPAYHAECASCHVAFPPQLLTTEDWRRVMANLDKHYGDNASLDEPTRRAIQDFLLRNAGSPSKVGASRAASPTALPRLTGTPWFQRKHRELSRSDWAHPKVKTPANCAACHTQATQGSFREREIVMPGRKED